MIVWRAKLIIIFHFMFYTSQISSTFQSESNEQKELNLITVPNEYANHHNISPAGCGLFGFNQIANGIDSHEGMYPFAALLYRNNQPISGATIITDKWLLTSAHNFRQTKNPLNFSIGVGSINVTRLQKYEIEKILIHEKYRKKLYDQLYDLAMIKLLNKLPFGQTIHPICLPSEYAFKPYSKWLKRGRVVGWGSKIFPAENFEPILQQVDLDIIPWKRCRRIYKGMTNLIPSQFCTHSTNKDACLGDSGGPFFAYSNQNDQRRAILFGIVSFGITCADEYPAVYTSVRHFLPWISKNIQQE